MKLQKKLDRGTFKARFGTKEACYQYLADLKWSDGYSCIKCGHNHYIKGNSLAVENVESVATMNHQPQVLYFINSNSV